MASRGVSIADEVVSIINAGSYTIADTFTAERHYVPEYELKDLTTLRVSVLLNNNPQQVIARNNTQSDYIITVAVQKKTQNITTDFDELVEFVEEINALFRLNRLPVTEVSWVASEIDPIYEPDYATRTSVFTSVLNLTFRDFLKK